MRFHKLDLNLLIVLDTLMTEESVGRTAIRLNLTQSAISNSLSKLRQHFQDELFIKTGRRMAPTPLTESMRDEVRHVLLQLQSIAERRPSFDPYTVRREFTVAASDYVAMVFLTDAMNYLGKVAPSVSINILPLLNTNVGLFGKGEVDLLIIPKSLAVPDQPYRALFNDEFTCIAWTGNRSAKSPLSVDKYLAAQHVIAAIDPSERVLAHDELHLQENGYKRDVRGVTPGFTLLPHFIIGSPYIATVHRRLAERMAKVLPIKIVDPELKFPPVSLVLQWHAMRETDIANTWIRDTLFELAGSKSSDHEEG